jgi:hypothetical protein
MSVGAGLVRGPQATKEIYMDRQDRQDKERADFRFQDFLSCISCPSMFELVS